MSLKLYLQNASPTYMPSTKRGAWDDAAASLTIAMGTSKSGAMTNTGVVACSSTDANYDVLMFRGSYVLDADTIFSGAVSGVFGILESADYLNGQLHVHAFLVQGQSDTLRSTLFSDLIDADEISTSSYNGEGFSTSVASPIAGYSGDVLVVEIGFRANALSTSYSATAYYGGTDATDLANNGQGATYTGWIEFATATAKGPLSDTVDLSDATPSVSVEAAQADTVALSDLAPSVSATAGTQADTFDLADSVAAAVGKDAVVESVELGDVVPDQYILNGETKDLTYWAALNSAGPPASDGAVNLVLDATLGRNVVKYTLSVVGGWGSYWRNSSITVKHPAPRFIAGDQYVLTFKANQQGTVGNRSIMICDGNATNVVLSQLVNIVAGWNTYQITFNALVAGNQPDLHIPGVVGDALCITDVTLVKSNKDTGLGVSVTAVVPTDSVALTDQTPSVTATAGTQTDTIDLTDSIIAAADKGSLAETVELTDAAPSIEASAEQTDTFDLADTIGPGSATIPGVSDSVDLTEPAPSIGATVPVPADSLELLDFDPEILIIYDPGPHSARSLVTLLDSSGNVVALLPAYVKWTRRLTAPDTLDEVAIPWAYLRSDGTLLSKVSALDTGWYALYDGGRYVIQSIDTDNESALTFDALSAEVDDLGNLFTNYSAGTARYLNMLPSEIATALLSGKVGRTVKNPGFGILDSNNLPTNWSHPVGWSSQLVSNRRVWQADACATSEESYSDDLPCTPGVYYRVKVDMKGAIGEGGNIGVKLRWIKADGSTVDSTGTYLSTKDGAFHAVETGSIVALGTRLRIVLNTGSTSYVSQFDDVKLYEIGPSSGWTYTGEMDARAAAIPYNDGAIQKYGVWAEGGTPVSYVYSSAVGDYIGRVINGPFVTINFHGMGVGAQAKVRVNGVVYTSTLDVSADTTYTVSGLDPSNDHIVEVEVAAVGVGVSSFTVSTDNLISQSFDDKTIYEALWAIAKAVGGELEFDPVAKTVHHYAARGQDLKANNVLEFRRGLNIVSMTKREERATKIINRLTYLGYGEGEYMLRVTVDAKGTNDDGDTSQDVYGVRRGLYTNKECKSLATAQSEAQQLVEEACWPPRSFDVQATDEAAALCEPGDTGHFVYGSINETLRILEISRTSDAKAATLVVALRSDPLVEQLVASSKALATLQKSYQGVPTDSNDSFSEQFERTSAGTDYPATIPFFIPYGADLIDLRLRYQIGGMRAFANAVGGGGGATTPSGGGATSGSGGGATLSQTSQTTPSGGGSTTPSGGGSTSGGTGAGIAVQPTVTRGPSLSSTWYEIKVNATLFATDLTYLQVGNFSGGTRSYSWQVRTASGGAGTLVDSGTISNLANGAFAVDSALCSDYMNSDLWVRVQQTTAGDGNWLFTAIRYGYEEHTHSTPSHTHTTPDHTHTVPAHSHTLSDHTHTTPAHAHTLPDHSHTLSYGIHESVAPSAGVRVYLDDTLITALNGLTTVSDFDLLPYIAKDSNGRVREGWHEVEFRSATNGDTGSVRGCLFASKFLSTEAL